MGDLERQFFSIANQLEEKVSVIDSLGLSDIKTESFNPKKKYIFSDQLLLAFKQYHCTSSIFDSFRESIYNMESDEYLPVIKKYCLHTSMSDMFLLVHEIDIELDQEYSEFSKFVPHLFDTQDKTNQTHKKIIALGNEILKKFEVYVTEAQKIQALYSFSACQYCLDNHHSNDFDSIIQEAKRFYTVVDYILNYAHAELHHRNHEDHNGYISTIIHTLK